MRKAALAAKLRRRRRVRWALKAMLFLGAIALSLRFHLLGSVTTNTVVSRLHYLQSLVMAAPTEEHRLKLLVHDAVSRAEHAVVGVVLAKKALVHRTVHGEDRANGKRILADSGGKAALTTYIEHEAAVAKYFVESLDAFARELWVKNEPTVLRAVAAQLHIVAKIVEREKTRIEAQRYVRVRAKHLDAIEIGPGPEAEAESLVKAMLARALSDATLLAPALRGRGS